MRVTIDVPDELIADLDSRPTHCTAERIVYHGIVEARPKPLKVGDYVQSMTRRYAVLGFGVDDGHRWLVVDGNEDGPFFYRGDSLDHVAMADGSPIEWPER